MRDFYYAFKKTCKSALGALMLAMLTLVAIKATAQTDLPILDEVHSFSWSETLPLILAATLAIMQVLMSVIKTEKAYTIFSPIIKVLELLHGLIPQNIQKRTENVPLIMSYLGQRRANKDK